MVMPDAQDNESSVMQRVANHVIPENEITDRIGLRSLRNATPHLGECTQTLHAGHKIGGDACGCSGVAAGDERTQTNKVSDSFLGINKPHLPACGGGNSSELPHDSSQEWTA